MPGCDDASCRHRVGNLDFKRLALMTIGFLPPIGVLAPLMTTSQSFTMAGCLAIGLRSVFPAARLYYRHQHSSQLGGDTMKRFWSAVCVAILVVCLGAVAAPAAHAYVPDGTQGWFWQTPQPAGDSQRCHLRRPERRLGGGVRRRDPAQHRRRCDLERAAVGYARRSRFSELCRHPARLGLRLLCRRYNKRRRLHLEQLHTGGAEPLPDERLLRR